MSPARSRRRLPRLLPPFCRLPRKRRWLRLSWGGPLILLASLLAGCKANTSPSGDAASQVIGLSTTLPLLWRDSGDIRGQLSPADAHWVLVELRRHGRVRALDTLLDRRGALPLPRGSLLVLAQPQPLAPRENLALDSWVRAGGRLLLFADPLVTAHSEFPLGDPRGPQRAVMLSPILRHWGVDLRFDPAQPAGERPVDVFGSHMPVDMAGSLSSASCRLAAQGVAADCRIGKGRALIVADASVLDGDDAGRHAAFMHLLTRIVR